MAPIAENHDLAREQPVQPDQASNEDIYITGIAGSFPESNSVKHLEENLFNKLDLITDDDRRWKPVDPLIPHRTGKIFNVDKFDASFFDVHYKRAHTMDTMGRILLEKAYECIIDAGYNPTEIRNFKTGVFIGSCFSESEKEWYYDNMHVNDYGLTCCARSMLANNVSRWLGVKGPSYTVDTACSSSLSALEHAVKSIQAGICDAAIVGGANLTLHPIISHRFARLGVLSIDGKCKSFDNKANGYVRSEAIATCFLQRAKHSRRVYAQVVHAKTNCDGYKEQGITYPSGHIQKQLLEEFYKECGIPPSSLEYVEAHGTGTTVGDPEELKAIDSVFCTGRSEPLLIGSIKSNLGHTEATSGICSIIKACIAYHSGHIPPNIHYHTPREGVPGLIEGRLQVVTEKRPWGRGLSGVSSFGFGGANAHALMKNVARDKVNNGLPSDDLPRLVCISGRTESSVAKILDDLETRTVDVDEVRLWHAIHENDIPKHHARGYSLLRSTTNISKMLSRSIQLYKDVGRTVWFVYPAMAPQSLVIAKQLMKISVFAASIQKCHQILEPKGMNLMKLIGDQKDLENNLHTFICVAAVQIGLTDLLETVGIKPDHIVGQGIGELGCAYADGHLTAEQTILAAYFVGQASDDTNGAKQQIGNDIAPKLLKTLKDVVPSKPRSRRWVSLREKVNKSSAENLISNVLQPVGFENLDAQFQLNSIVVEVASHGQLQEVFKKTVQNKVTNVALTSLEDENVEFLLTALGKLFEAGLNPKLANIYPKVQFPVSQRTPMLAHLVEWDHSENWTTSSFKTGEKISVAERTARVSTDYDDLEYLVGHCIDGRILYPATGYLVLVWETLSLLKGCLQQEISVVFENISFHRATTLPKSDTIEFIISIHKGSGDFEVTENGVSVVTGRAYEKKNVGRDYRVIPSSAPKETAGHNKVVMLAKDFYKELNLRGYQYKGLFRGVLGCNVDGTKGRLQWNNNWVTFLDTLLQPAIVTHDTRCLYVPTRIERLSIDVDLHNEIISKLDPHSPMSVEYNIYPTLELTRASGVELRGLHVTAISKKPALGIPVFETNEFIASYSYTTMKLQDILRANLQLVFENIHTHNFKCIELVDEEYKKNSLEPAIEGIGDVLADLPLVRADLLVISEDDQSSESKLTLPSNITVSNVKVTSESNCIVFIGANLLERPEVLVDGLSTLKDNCFVISREQTPPEPQDHPKYDLVTVLYTGSEYYVLLRKKLTSKPTKFIKIVTADETYSWIDEVKEEMKNAQKIVLYNEGERINGLLGLVNCLRREPGGDIFNGVLIADPSAPKFDPELPIYKDQLEKGLAMNVFKNGNWGTYRHLLLEDLDKVHSPHAYVNTTTLGDLSSLRWLQGSLTENHEATNPGEQLVHVYCSALNFRDIMTAMGRVTLDAVARGRLAQDCVQGIEVSGRTSSGARVMAICEKGITNLATVSAGGVWCIPDEWTFEEAATVPVAYCTVYMALVMIGKIRRGESILIHAGSGGVGQAAISVSLHHGLEVFTTVGTPAKREFIKKLFPQLQDSHIGNSRDTTFEEMIQRETNGRGVDLVLNSLADDKLQASVKCLAHRGRFLEIGKYDITINTPIEMCFLKKEISFHGVMLDFISNPESINLRKTLQKLLVSGIASGAVRPLTNCTFGKDQIESAYRYMASGKHIGKVIIKIRDEEHSSAPVKPSPIYIDAEPRYTCNKHRVYILIGGLGGFGLELADWLVLRGARKLILTSRKGVSNGYQALRLKIWAEYGTNVQISTLDITTKSACEEMLKLANSMGPVEAIFNLAVVLKDAIFQNQTSETFATSFGPKALATINLDKISRILCPELKDFVIFSSVSCGRGNAGQTNYGFSNSVMERICEERKEAGLPALAIQWGAIADVGLVADMQEENIQIEIGGTLQQRITSCLDAMDKFLKQGAAIVSSIVVAEKRSGGAETGSSVNAIAQIMGIRDMKTVSLQAPLSELGMDSIMAVEIKQTLERDFEIFLSPQEIRMLTFARLFELGAATDTSIKETQPISALTEDDTLGLEYFITYLGDEKMSYKPYIYMPTKVSDGNDESSQISDPIMFLLPGLESCGSSLRTLCSKLNIRACVLQLGLEYPHESLDEMIERLYSTVKPRIVPGKPFYLLGYSFGTILILKLAAKLENDGHKGVVFCVDGSPDFICAYVAKHIPIHTEHFVENILIYQTFKIVTKDNTLANTALVELDKKNTYNEKFELLSKMCSITVDYSQNFLSTITKVCINRMMIILDIGKKVELETVKKILSPIVLLRPRTTPHLVECKENYNLDRYTESGVTVHHFDAGHIGIVECDESANIINEVLAGPTDEPTDKVATNVVTNLIEKKPTTQVSI